MKIHFDSELNNNYAGANFTIMLLIAFFSTLFVLFNDKFNHPDYIANGLVFLVTLSVMLILLSSKINNQRGKATIQTIFVLGFFAYFYSFISDFQLIVHTQWQDSKLIALDNYLFGSEISLIMQSIVSPYLTEAMMFAYVFYLPLLIIVGIVAFRAGNARALGEYLFALSLGYTVCYLGFILFPVASQMYFKPGQYETALEGGLFTFLGELMRSDAHFPGGNLPSPHCMAATIMLFVLFKYNRKLFYLSLPLILLLYVSTVYCRFHYAWDGVIAIVLAIILIKVLPVFQKLIDMFVLFYNSILHPMCISESLSDK